MKEYLAKAKHGEQFIHIKPAVEHSKRGLAAALTVDNKSKTGKIEVNGLKKLDLIKTVTQYAVTDVFKEQFKICQTEMETISIFLIDSSGSMMQKQQIACVKGMIEKTIERFKQKRVYYAVIALQQGEAIVAAALTKNTNTIVNAIGTLTTGGKTNMTAGLQLVHQQLKNTVHKKCSLYIFTDGRINMGTTASPFTEAISYYRTFLKQIKMVHVVNTETGFVKLKRSKEFAMAIGANYSCINDF